jgi:GT2 family glycosyltransferase
MLHYDRPFNHSAECNLAAREATGEVLVFLNNDAELRSVTALRSMCSWSLLPGVGTVGVRIMDGDRGVLVSAGISTHLASGPDYRAFAAESTDPFLAHHNRETLGNSFACTAVSRRTFGAIGPLDEMNFPIGYNDLDFNLRCRRAGLTNIYLGTEWASHVPGRSRGNADELFERIHLRRVHSWIFESSLFQLQIEHRPPVAVTVSVHSARVGVLRRLGAALSRRARRVMGSVRLRGAGGLARATGRRR